MANEFIARNGIISRGNLLVTGSLTTSGSLTATGTITATTLVVQTVTSSISSITGSTNFGSLSSNTHTFTGSILTSGSIGIGIGNPNSNLEVYCGVGSVFRAVYNGNNSVEIGNYRPVGSGAGYQDLTIGSSQVNIITGAAGGSTASTRLFVGQTGNVGIGTSNPGAQFVIASTQNNASNYAWMTFRNLANGYGTWGFYKTGSNDLALAYSTDTDTPMNNATAITFKYGGNVGIGTSSPGMPLHVKGNASYLGFGDNVIVSESSVSNYAGIMFTGTSGQLAAIRSEGGNTMTFWNYNSGWSERMRITSGGALCVNTTSAFASGLIAASGDTGTFNLLALRDTGTTYIDNWYVYCVNNSTSRAGGIQHTGSTSVSFITTSDYRLKKNPKPIENGLNKILALKPVTYNWVEDDSEGEGFYAHELQEYIPFAVSGIKDAVDKDGNINPQGVDYSKIVPTLVKAIQELTARVQELENK